MDAFDLAQGTAYASVKRLVDAGVLDATTDEQPRTYAVRDIHLTVTAVDGMREYTITPALIDAVARRVTDDDIDPSIDRLGIPGLATALTYAVDSERVEVSHRQMARDLDISPLAAETILKALRPVVPEHIVIKASGASVAAIEGVDEDTFDDT